MNQHKNEKRLNHVKTLLCFEALHKSIFLIILIPLASFLFQLALKVSKYSYITLQNLLSFSTSPMTILAILFILFVAVFLIYMEFVTLFQYFHCNQTNRKLYVAHLLFPGLKQSLFLLRKKENLLLPFFCMICDVVYSFPIYIGMISKQRIPSYFFDGIKNESWVIPTLSFLVLLLIYVCYRGMFTLFYCCYDGVSFHEGFRMSKRTITGNRKSIITTLISRNLIVCVIYVVIYYALLLFLGVLIFFVVKDSLATVTFLTAYDQINRYYGFFAAMIGILVNFKINFSMFMKYRITSNDLPGFVKDLQDKITKEGRQLGKYHYWTRLRKGRYSRIILAISLMSFLILSITLILQFTNSLFRQKAPLFGTYITAHRGYSPKAPENTLPAIQEAIDAKSDYVEMDVQETKDGVVVLFHDTNLKE